MRRNHSRGCEANRRWGVISGEGNRAMCHAIVERYALHDASMLDRRFGGQPSRPRLFVEPQKRDLLFLDDDRVHMQLAVGR